MFNPVGCPWVLQILTLFQTKKCHFRDPFSDQTSKIHTRFQTWPLGRNYVQCYLGCIHYVCYRGGGGGGGGGGQRIFFQRLVFLYPQGPYKFSLSPPGNQPKNEYPPSFLTRNIKINICIIVHYICLKFQETCLIRTSREL